MAEKDKFWQTIVERVQGTKVSYLSFRLEHSLMQVSVFEKNGRFLTQTETAPSKIEHFNAGTLEVAKKRGLEALLEALEEHALEVKRALADLGHPVRNPKDLTPAQIQALITTLKTEWNTCHNPDLDQAYRKLEGMLEE